jgi:hypothetical protein
LNNYKDPQGQFTISNDTYNLKMSGKIVCPRFFAALNNVSYNTLRTIATSLNDNNEDENEPEAPTVCVLCVS